MKSIVKLVREGVGQPITSLFSEVCNSALAVPAPQKEVAR
jgi:hypothetical protein